jgi:hypothetical protein
MLKLLLVFSHLFGTCLALGMMAMTDLRLLSRVAGYRVVIEPPTPFELRVITSALALLLATGAMLIILGLHENPSYLIGNEKLQAKLLLVALLCTNALFLHFGVFHHLSRRRPVTMWTKRQFDAVAVSVGLSNSMWLYCAFLGIARTWNQGMPMQWVLLIGLALFAAMACAARLVLAFAARPEPASRPDWIDHIKRALNEPASPLRGYDETMLLADDDRIRLRGAA